MNKFFKLCRHVLKRYEPELDTYYFYNAKDKVFWQCDYSTGEVVSCLDGTICVKEIIDILSANNPDIPIEGIENKISETFEFLSKENFIYEN